MREIVAATVVGLAVGAGGAALVSTASRHAVHIYDTPPAREATAGLEPVPGTSLAPAKTPAAVPPANPGGQVESRVAAAPVQPAATVPPAAADLAAGERLFNQCMACHTLKAGQASALGPNLHGVFGRRSGTLAGFKFSDAMAKAGVAWDEAAIDKYVADPKGFMPGNRMAFAGLRNAEQRRNLVGFLRQATQ